jgi:hypothetical protein
MADITLDRVDAIGDYLTDEVYEVQFVNLYTGASLTAEDINLRCNTFTIPDTDVNYLTVTHRTFTKEQPTHRNNAKDVTFTMVESMTPRTLPFLQEWANRCATKGTNFVFPPSQRQCEVLVYHKRNDKTIARVYNLKKCQLVTKGDIALGDGSSPAAIIPSITMKTQLILEGPSVSELG